MEVISCFRYRKHGSLTKTEQGENRKFPLKSTASIDFHLTRALRLLFQFYHPGR